jgi:hypothetical protein
MTLEDALFLAMHKYGLDAYVETSTAPGMSRLYCDDGQLKGDGCSESRVRIVGMREYGPSCNQLKVYGRGSTWDAAFEAADKFVALEATAQPPAPGVPAGKLS